jgi:neurotransmitter:Na+ symporter, NSS family
MSNTNESWGSRIGLILAMAGNAVGLGNFLRFPVQAVNNGGGAFIIPYLISFLVMGIPLLWVEWSMGRYGGVRGNHSTPFIFGEMGKHSFWKYFGVFGIFTNIAVASYYCYIESWTMSYTYHTILQTFSDMTQQNVAAFFDEYISFDKGYFNEAVIFYLVCLVLNTWILSKGLTGGVEKVAKIGMPLLIIFGIFLAYKGLTLGTSGAPAGCPDCDGYLGLNFLWEPQFSSLYDPKVWLAAATQIFFTLSLGMGSIHCYASYVKYKDDIALNSMSAGWMNEFVEVVLGAAIVIPIAAGYLGLDWVKENAGFSMAFKTMPFLFSKWGIVIGTFAGVAWFGLLFFAGITSSLAMGTPWMGFMEDEFKWSRSKSAWSFGLITLIVGLPTVYFFHKGVFDEYDYWAGSIGLMVFALAECILFAWIFGIDKGFDEINKGADMKIHAFFKPILKYVTPALLILIFVGALITPKGNDWIGAIKNGWELDPSSVIGKISNKSYSANKSYFANKFESEVSGTVTNIDEKKKEIRISELKKFYIEEGKIKLAKEENYRTSFDSLSPVKTYNFKEGTNILIKKGDQVSPGTPLAEGSFINDIFYVDLSRVVLIALFVFICFVVFLATKKREKNKLTIS